MKLTKKVLTILITIAMLTALAIPVIAAETSSGTANTLRLESVEGSASVKNASGKALTSRSGMRLYSGYEIATEKASYAYFSLDSTKAVKMDASSKGEVFQSSKKLELKLTAGSLFFDVTAPVKANESLTIRTSTMVTGVRGTCGWVEIVDRYTTRFSLLEGELEITSIDPLTSNERSITIVGGQTATVVYHGEMNDYVTELFVERLTVQKLAEAGAILDMDVLGEMIAAGVIPEDATLQELINSGVILDEEALHDLLAEGGMDEETIQQLLESGMLPEDVTIQKLIQEGTIREEHIILDGTGLTVEELQEEDVPGYVAVEVEKNEDLQQRIETNTDLDVEEIIGDAEERLAEEEAADEAADQTIQEAFETLTAEDTNPLFEEEEEESAGDSSTSVAPAPTAYDLDDPTTAEVQQALDDGYTTLNITNANLTQTWDITQTPIDTGITYNVQSGTVSVPANGTLDVNGTLNINERATLNNSGTININSMNSLDVSGVLNNGFGGDGVINVGKDAPGALRVSGELGNGFGYSGTIYVASTANSGGSVLEVSGMLRNGGATVAGLYFGSGGGTLEVKDGGTLENNVNITIPENSTLITSGNIQLGAGITNYGAFNITGGSVTDASHVTIKNCEGGTITVSDGWFRVSNAVDNEGTVIVSGGEVTCSNTSAFVNTGTLNMTGGTVSGTTGIEIELGTVNVDGGTVVGSNYGIYSPTSGAGQINVKNGTIQGNQYGIYNGGALLTISGGTIENTNELLSNGAGVRMNSDRGATISGGTITSPLGYGIHQANGTMTVSGDTATTGGAYGLYVESGTLNFNGGTATGASAGIYGGGSFTNDIVVTGGTIQGGDFGGICKYSNGTLVVSGTANVSGTLYGIRLQNGVNTVTIKDNVQIRATDTTGVSPYALYNDCSNVTIAGGTIISDHPNNGYGISNTDGGTMSIAGCTVNATTAIHNGGTLTIGDGAKITGTKYGLFNSQVIDAENNVTGGVVTITGGEITATGAGSSGIYNVSSVGNENGNTIEISGNTDIAGVEYGIYNNEGGRVHIFESDPPVTVKKTSKTQDGYVLYRVGTDSGFDVEDGCRLWFYTNQNTAPSMFCAQNDEGNIYRLEEPIGTVSESTDGSSYCFELIWKSGV